MTRTQPRSYGVTTPSSRQPLLEAMLRAFVWLVSNVASLFGMTINRNTRDWHTDAAHENQLPTSNDIQKEAKTTQPSFSGKAAGRIPGIPVVSTQGTATYSLCATNQDARHKAEHDSIGADVLTIWKRGTRVPGEGQDPVSVQRALAQATSLSPLIPTNVGIQGEPRVLSELAASTPHPQQNRSWIPTPHPELVEGRRNERFLLRKLRLI